MEEIVGNFNNKHPELLEGEIFLINIKKEEDWSHQFSEVKSTRVGDIAYTCDGKIVRDFKPLFGVPK